MAVDRLCFIIQFYLGRCQLKRNLFCSNKQSIARFRGPNGVCHRSVVLRRNQTVPALIESLRDLF